MAERDKERIRIEGEPSKLRSARFDRRRQAAMLRLAMLLLVCGSCSLPGNAADPISRKDWGAAPPLEARDEAKAVVFLRKLQKIDQKTEEELLAKIANREEPKTEDVDLRVEKKMGRRTKDPPLFLTVHHTGRPVRKAELNQNPRQAFKAQVKSFERLVRGGYDLPPDANGRTKWVFLGDIPYHYLIDDSGLVAIGRELKHAPYSNTTYKTELSRHITVVLEGNFDDEHPTDAQVRSLTELLSALAIKHNIDLKNINFHQNVTAQNTSCPGKNLIAVMDGVITMIEARVKK